MARLVCAVLAAVLVVLVAFSSEVRGQAYPQAAANAASALLSDIDARFDEVLAAISALQLSCNAAASPSRSPAPPSPSRSPAAASPSRSPAAPSPSRSPAAASPSPSSSRPPVSGNTITVGPGQTYTEPADAIPFLTPGFTMNVLAGTYYKPFDIPDNLGPWTINGAGGGNTIFDGRGGAGAGFRLAWGKGFVHARSPGTLSNIVFRNSGGADGSADGEAAVYAESFTAPGTITINRCLFDSNENGIFVPGGGSGNPGNGISIVATNCDFINNGQSQDGGSHDLYVQGDSYSETNCNHYGNPFGNNIKVRSPVLSVTGGYHANRVGSRWIDYPNGGRATISGGIFTIPSTSGGGNVLSYAIENQNNGVTGGMSFSGSSRLYVGRTNTQIYVASGGRVSFDSTVLLTWTSSGASISVLGGGQVTGIATTPGTSTIGSEPAIPGRVSGN